MAEERALYNANDGLTGRDGGPYLDQQENINAEIRRAKVEGREPDLDNPGPSAGVVLLNAGQVLANRGVNNLPSQDGNDFLSAAAAVKGVEDDETNALQRAATVPAEGIDESPHADLSMRTALAGDKAEEIDESDDVSGEPADESDTEPVFGDTESDVIESDETSNRL